MKKIIFIILCVSIVICAFTLSVSAFDMPSGEELIEIDSIPNKGMFGLPGANHTDGYYHADVAKVEITYDGEIYLFPTYYIIENHSDLKWYFDDVESYLSSLLGETVELNVGNITRIEIPFGITHIVEKAFVLPGGFDEANQVVYADMENTTLTFVRISNTVLEIDDYAFAHCVNLQKVEGEVGTATGDHDHLMIQTIGKNAFHHCENLHTFPFNNHLTHLGESCFEGCGLSSINLSKCVQLSVIPNNAFHNMQANTLSEIILPNSIAYIGDNAFTADNGLTTDRFYIGTGVKYIGHNAVALKKAGYLFFPVTLDTIFEDSIDMGTGSDTVIITGPYDEASAEHLASVLDPLFNQKISGDKIISATQSYFSEYGDAFCEEYLGGHTIDSNSTISSVYYPKGFAHEGYAVGTCGVCLRPAGERPLTPIVVCKGFSICEYNGMAAFTNGFEIYHDALQVYEAVHGELEIGLVFLSDSVVMNSGSSDLLSMNGIKVMVTSASDVEEITITDFNYAVTYSKGLTYEDENGNLVDRGNVDLVIAAYITGNIATNAEQGQGTGDIFGNSYIQDEDDVCASKVPDGNREFYAVSYNSIHGYIKSISE